MIECAAFPNAAVLKHESTGVPRDVSAEAIGADVAKATFASHTGLQFGLARPTQLAIQLTLVRDSGERRPFGGALIRALSLARWKICLSTGPAEPFPTCALCWFARENCCPRDSPG